MIYRCTHLNENTLKSIANFYTEIERNGDRAAILAEIDATPNLKFTSFGGPPTAVRVCDHFLMYYNFNGLSLVKIAPVQSIKEVKVVKYVNSASVKVIVHFGQNDKIVFKSDYGCYKIIAAEMNRKYGVKMPI